MSATVDDRVHFLRTWAEALPQGTADLVETQVPRERVVRITPRMPGASQVEFRLGDDGGFGLYFGCGFSFEEIAWSVELVVDILDSIRRGGFREEVWEWGGRIVRTEGRLKLKSGRSLADKGYRLPGLLRLGTVREVKYAPWDRDPGGPDA